MRAALLWDLERVPVGSDFAGFFRSPIADATIGGIGGGGRACTSARGAASVSGAARGCVYRDDASVGEKRPWSSEDDAANDQGCCPRRASVTAWATSGGIGGAGAASGPCGARGGISGAHSSWCAGGR